MADEDKYFLPRSKPAGPLPEIAVYETYTTESGERLTVATIGKPVHMKFEFRADEIFQRARKIPGIMVSMFNWHFIMPWLANDPADVQRFALGFDSEFAEKARHRALKGVKSKNYEDEASVVRLAVEIVGLTAPHLTIPGPIQPAMTGLHSDCVEHFTKRISEWVVNAVLYDHDAPKRLHQLLKNPDVAVDPKGDQLSFAGKILTAFIQLVVEDEALPTKKHVRTRAGLGDEQKDLSAASRVFRELGLQGLPEG